tara:strand:+ start:194 stop:535 length:342 start_codon:yes stop_codon:yes gene_type:complete
MANRRCKQLPGIDRSGEPKINFKAGSSALQMITNKDGVKTARRQTNVAEEAPKGFAPTRFLGGIMGMGKKEEGGMSTVGKLLNPAAAIGEKLGAGKDTLVGKILNPLSIFGKK